MTEVAIGIIGAGDFAIARARNFSQVSGCRVVAGWSRSKRSRARFEAKTGAQTVTDWQQLCADARINAILVCTPNAHHYPQALAALQAGKHVMVETPLAMSYAEGEQLARVAASGSLALHHAAKWRFHPEHMRVIEDLRSVGSLVHAQQVTCWSPGLQRAWYRDFELSGGAFAFLPYVSVNLFEAFGEVRLAEGSHVRGENVDAATMRVVFEAGGEAYISYVIGDGVGTVDTLTLVGSRATLYRPTGSAGRLMYGDNMIRECAPPADMDVLRLECQAFVAEVVGARDFRLELELDLRILQAVSLAQEQTAGR